MNTLESNLVLGTLQSAFPSFYRGLGQKAARDIADLWAKMFEDDDFKSVMAAVQALIATRTEGYPPTIGEVKEKLGQLRCPEELSEQDAWALVSKACQNGYYHATEEFENLPEVVQRAVGSPEQLKAWSQMDASTVESVVASNFMRTFKVKQKQQKELDMIPSEARQYIAAVSDKMSLNGEYPGRARLERPRQVTLEALKLEKLGVPQLEKVLPKPVTPAPAAYKPPSSEEWAKRREEALAKLGMAREANNS